MVTDTSVREVWISTTVGHVLQNYLPDRHNADPGAEWTWEDAAAELETRICMCCDKPGHYQRKIEELVRTRGIGFADHNDPIGIGSDGFVLDGHHRLIAVRNQPETILIVGMAEILS